MSHRSTHVAFHSLLLLLELTIYKLKFIGPERYGVWLANRFDKLGGAFIKIGQLLSVRPDIISFSICRELHPLLQQLNPVPIHQIIDTLKGQYKGQYHSLFVEIEPVPLGTGSIAQVHKIKLANGKFAVAKIIKPGLEKNFQVDMKMFRFFMRAGSYLPGLRKLPVKELTSEINALMERQLNLQREGENLQEFRKNFCDDESVIIPEWYKRLSRPGCIILEYIPLPAIPDFTSWHETKRTTVAQKALRMLYQMMFKDGFTHCDLHPGNFFVTNEGKFILLDFGMVTRMEENFRNDFIRFFFYMSTNNGKGCAAIIEKTSLHKAKGFKREKLDEEVSLFISEFSSLPAEQFSVLAFTTRLIQVERKCGIKGATAFINNILAIAFFESRLKQIAPAIDFQEVAAEYILYNVQTIAKIVREL